MITHGSPSSASLQGSSSSPANSGRRSLHRTLSDESIYRGQRLPSLGDPVLEQALASDVLFSCSTLPRSPTTRGAPLRRPSYKMGIKMHGEQDVNHWVRILPLPLTYEFKYVWEPIKMRLNN